MGLNPIAPGLRRFGYDAVSAAKVQIVVQPGDEIEVSDVVAAQLVAQSPQFKPIDSDAARPPVPVEEAEVAPEAKPTRRRTKSED